jgi:hypothetical protein
VRGKKYGKKSGNVWNGYYAGLNLVRNGFHSNCPLWVRCFEGVKYFMGLIIANVFCRCIANVLIGASFVIGLYVL